MNSTQYREDWLSAYLDGELSEEQREIVESRLATDPNARATLEDLNRIRLMVAKLPAWNGPSLQFSLPADALKPKPAYSTDDDSSDDLDSRDSLTDDSDSTIITSQAAPSAAEFDDVAMLESNVENETLSNDSPSWNTDSPTRRFNFGWLAAAACIAIMVGIGGLLWRPWASDFSVARLSPNAPAGKLDSQDNWSLEYTENASDMPADSPAARVENAPTATQLGMPNPQNSQMGFATQSERLNESLPSVGELNILQVDDSEKKADLLNQSESALAAIPLPPAIVTPSATLEMMPEQQQTLTLPMPGKNVESSLADNQTRENAMGAGIAGRGLGGAGAEGKDQPVDPLDAVSANPPKLDAPATNERYSLREPDLAKQSLADNARVDGSEKFGIAMPRESAALTPGTFNNVEQLARAKDAQRVAKLRVARSHAWSEQEIDQSLSIAAVKLGVSVDSFRGVLDEGRKILLSDDFANADNVQSGKSIALGKTSGAKETAKLMIAAIDGGLAAEKVFLELVQPKDGMQAGTEGDQSKNQPMAEKELAGQSVAELPPPSAANQDAKAKRLAEPQVQSIVLYVSGVEAEKILSQLKEKGAVKHNAWVIVPASPDMKPSDQKVILILNGPP